MKEELKNRLREDLEYWHAQGDVAEDDEYKIGVEESEYNVLDQEVVWDDLKASLMTTVGRLVGDYTPRFNGDRHAVIGAIVEILNREFS